MRFTFIAKHRGIWPVAWICEALGVSRSGFHAWLTRAPSQRSRDDEEIGARIRASHIGSYRTYGARRVWHDLLAEGYQCGLHKIERLMRDQGLRARPRRRGLPKDQGERSVIAGNVLDRQFTADKPNQKWVADGTVRIFVCGEAVNHQAVMALMKRSPKSTANCAFAMVHSRGGIFHSFSDRFKIR